MGIQLDRAPLLAEGAFVVALQREAEAFEREDQSRGRIEGAGPP